ncbi:hypothetical protein BAE30_06095 [Acidithiobacillus caldus]|uniref:Uncharacterized protein n=1 Tax=Acidithiobacillus caldus TaxID=33059 RepID=A0A1E7YX34_9PROT|nr:hypothetical protein BAE30_06095 [Acidithiobacillus caldus]
MRHPVIDVEAHRKKTGKESQGEPCAERYLFLDRVDFSAFVVAVDFLWKLATGLLGLFLSVIVTGVLFTLLPAILSGRIKAEGAFEVDVLTGKATDVSIEEHRILSDKDKIDTKMAMGLKSRNMLRNRSTRGTRTEKTLSLVDDDKRARRTVHPSGRFVEGNDTGKTIEVKARKARNKDLNRNRNTIDNTRRRSSPVRGTDHVIMKGKKRFTSAGKTSANCDHDEALTGKTR